MKKTYLQPRCTIVEVVHTGSPLMTSQDNWGDAKETDHASGLWDNDNAEPQGSSWSLDADDQDWP